MAGLPDISDLIEVKETLVSIGAAFRKLGKKADESRTIIEDNILKRYRAAGVTKDDCDHPIIRYMGMGDSECGYCRTDVRSFPEPYVKPNQ